IVIMTHNVHFYLNVPPHGAFKDENGKTKYDKNNFYSIRRGHFIQIENEKQDFKTNYDALWSELQDLSENNLTNSMLNSMRRIIETYIEFTGISQNDFYKNNEQYLKLFNVNSHSAIDSVSAEAFTESSQELVASFHQIFKDNNAEAHFKSHWNVESK
ncbi:AAA family ATPase, partial [Lactiplantibacillus mudanjiangensis]